MATTEVGRGRTRASTILVTNDDGVSSPGLHALAASLADAGEDVLVVAPCEDFSGSSASIGRLHADAPVEIVRTELAGAPDVPAVGIRGSPALAVMAARLGAFGDPPDIVVSGVNAGLNTGHSILHSGTVGAVLTAQNFGGAGVAVSLAPSDPWHWDSACALVHVAVGMLRRRAGRAALNINVPARPVEELSELRWATLDRFGTVRATIASSTDRALQIEYRETGAELDPGCDTALVEAGHATITSLVGVSALDPDTEPAPISPVARAVQAAPEPEATEEHEVVALDDASELAR
jgi:5'-nucleotidase